MMNLELEGKVAIVTGGANGIGRNIAENLAAEGCKIALIDIKEEDGTALAKTLEEQTKARFYPCDLSSHDAMTKTFDDIMQDFGQVDILINNAGVPVRGYIEDIDEERWDKFNDVNMKAPFFLSKLAAEDMRKRGWGRILNMSSGRSKIIDFYHPGYSITKAALNSIAENFAIRYAQWGINTNSLLLGFVLTPMTEHYLDDPKDVEMLKKANPQYRLIEMQEVSDVVKFLVSDYGKAVNAQLLCVDGGSTKTIGILNK